MNQETFRNWYSWWERKHAKLINMTDDNFLKAKYKPEKEGHVGHREFYLTCLIRGFVYLVGLR